MAAPPTATELDIAGLPATRVTGFALAPDKATRRALAEALDVIEIRKLNFTGQIAPASAHDWQLTGHLGATVVQACVVTLEPVTTRIEADVARLYLEEFPDPETGEETEIPEDDTVERLPATLDLAEVMAEALALNLPEYPRKEGVELPRSAFAPPGAAPLKDDDLKPFAGLAELREKLNRDKEN